MLLQIFVEVDLDGDAGAGRSVRVDSSEAACSLVDDSVVWLAVVSQAQQLRLATRDRVDTER